MPRHNQETTIKLAKSTCVPDVTAAAKGSGNIRKTNSMVVKTVRLTLASIGIGGRMRGNDGAVAFTEP